MLNKEQIKEIIPQREPFLMIDEVEEYTPGESATAYKNVSEDEYYFKGHFPGNPICFNCRIFSTNWCGSNSFYGRK